MQAVIQLGEVVTTLGDRVWATWFASGSATSSPQNVSILGTARVPLKARQPLHVRDAGAFCRHCSVDVNSWPTHRLRCC